MPWLLLDSLDRRSTISSVGSLAHHNILIPAQSVSSLGLRDASDFEIFQAAQQAAATIISKDQDFVDLVTMHGAPPQIIWVTCGNTSNAYLCTLLQRTFPTVLTLLESGEPLVELSGNL